MKYFQRIDEDCAIAAQLTPAQIQQLPNAGFHSVLNLRSPEESGVLGDEQQQIEALHLLRKFTKLVNPYAECLISLSLVLIPALPPIG